MSNLTAYKQTSPTSTPIAGAKGESKSTFLGRGYSRNPSSPELLENDYNKAGTGVLLDLMGKDLSSLMPTRQVAGLNTELTGAKTLVGDIMSGKAFQDPRTSPLYQGVRTELADQTEKGASAIRRQANTGGMLRSSGALRAEGDYRRDMDNQAATLLGQLFESERNRDNEYTRLNAASSFGEQLRNIENEENNAEYEGELMKVLAPYMYQAPIATQMSEYGNYWSPIYDQQASGMENTASFISGIGLPLIGLKYPGAVGKSGGGGGSSGTGAAIGGAAAGGAAGGVATAGTKALMTALIPALSDRRAKENVVKIDDALAKVQSLDGFTYNYIHEAPSQRNGGVMAQDLEKVLPEAVVEMDGIKYVKYDAVIGLLVNAVKELSDQVKQIREAN